MISAFRLGSRLKAIYELVAQVQQQTAYSRIWDCCCDHGYLGIKILSDNLCEKLVFVDQVPHIMEKLSLKLALVCSAKYELITADAGELCFDPNQRHLVILSGVGGECMVDILSAIARGQADAEIDYILCPSASQKALREYLVEQGFGLVFESIACEKKRYYEILFVRSKAAASGLPRVSINNSMWQSDNSEHQRYLSKLARHEMQKRLGKSRYG